MKQSKKLSFYEVNPRYFKDYSGNGTGDLIGLANKFDYFNHINVDAIILQEVLSTDSLKAKTKSFTTVDSEIGDINGIIKIISLAKASKKKVLIELNIGSVAENHNWFRSSQEKGVDDYKNVIDFKPKKVHEDIKYKYSSENKQYYAIDSNTQEVQINWGSEQVIDNFIKVIRFWIDLGIDGFVFKNFEYAAEEEQKIAMSKKTLKELRKFYRSIKEINDNVLVVGKTDFLPLESANNYTDGATKVFDYFWSTEFSKIGLHNKFKQDAIGKFHPRLLVKKLKDYAFNPSNIVAFNSSQFGKVLSRWLNDMQFIGESAKTLATLLIFNKSSSLIYFGDEIGTPNIGLTHLDNFQDRTIEKRKSIAMQANLSEKEFFDAQVSQGKINARALMSWSADKNGGFSVSEKTITPVSSRYKEINVTNQFKNNSSVLNFYIELIRLAHHSSYSSVIRDGVQKISSPMFGVIKNKIVFDSKEIIIFSNLTSGKKSLLLRPKFGKVILSSYFMRDYKEIPKNLDAYETIVISKRTDEYNKETQMIKIEALKAKEAAKKEEIFAKQAEEKAKIAQAKEEEKTKLIALKLEEEAKEKERLIKIKEKEEKEKAVAAQKAEEARKIQEEKLAIEKAKEAEQKAKEAEEKHLSAQKAKEEKAKQKQEAHEAREFEKTKQMELKAQAKEEKAKQKQEAHEAKELEKTKQMEIKAKEAEEKHLAAQKAEKEKSKQEKENKINTNNKNDEESLYENKKEDEIKSDDLEVDETTNKFGKEEKLNDWLEFQTQESMIEKQFDINGDLKDEKESNQDLGNKKPDIESDNMFDFENDLNDINLKEDAHELKVEDMSSEQKSKIDIAKENAKIEKEAEDSYKDEATKLKEEEIAKTTLVDDSFDIDDLFGDEKEEKDK